MRIRDLLRPYEDGLVRILDETPPGIDVRRQLVMPEGIEYAVGLPGSPDPVSPGTVVLTLLGPDPRAHGDPGNAGKAIARLQPGARAMVLFAWPAGEVPYERILDELTDHACQALQVSPLDLGVVGIGAIVERVDDLQIPRDGQGEPLIVATGDGPDRLAIGLRLANELAFVTATGRGAGADPNAGSADLYEGGFESYRSRLDRQLRERDARIGDLERQVARYEASGALKLGRILVAAARSPRALARLPLDLVRMWRSKGA